MSKKNMPWSGRFQSEMNRLAFDFSKSLSVDSRLAIYDIDGSLAHLKSLSTQKIIPQKEAALISKKLEAIKKSLLAGTYQFDSSQEDVHMAIESDVRQDLPFGGKIHTARSRNDQVALDERLFLRDAISTLRKELRYMQVALVKKAEEHANTIMPGYTHLQRAQPILLAHHLLAYANMFERDRERFADAYKRLNYSPLGAAALAGTPFPIDRDLAAHLLNFDGVLLNSIDAVSDRDYLIEFISVCAVSMMHLSRMAEEFVLWSTQEFKFIKISDAFSTGSSIMPQKKNPDMAELVRGKVGKVYGNLMNILTTMKALPLAYNRDMQEDKSPMFEAFDTLSDCLKVFAAMLETTTFDKESMNEATKEGFCTATEIADYLAAKHVPFRTAHEVAGSIVGYAIAQHKTLDELSLSEYQHFSKDIEDDIFERIKPESTIRQKKSKGSTSYTEVRKQLAYWQKIFKKGF